MFSRNALSKRFDKTYNMYSQNVLQKFCKRFLEFTKIRIEVLFKTFCNGLCFLGGYHIEVYRSTTTWCWGPWYNTRHTYHIAVYHNTATWCLGLLYNTRGRRPHRHPGYGRSWRPPPRMRLGTWTGPPWCGCVESGNPTADKSYLQTSEISDPYTPNLGHLTYILKM